MTIILSPELEKLIQEKVRAGEYPSAHAMVTAAIARLLELEVDEEFAPGELEAMVKIGTDQLDRGEVLDGKKVFDDLRQRSAAFRTGHSS